MTELTIEELLVWQAYKATIRDVDSKIGILKTLEGNYCETDRENGEHFWKEVIHSLNSRICNLKKKRTELSKMFKEIDDKL